jgi:phenylpropionate dioxygenase-like ring-hydroxylating dioxygenase large terminal subunit
MQAEQSKLLTETGPGTPMGNLMRRYWLPIALSSQVAEPDSAPLTTWLLGERFVVFRDTSGKVGVLDDACMHRGVSLGLARNEEGGLRCIYHGWKFDVEGNILDTPNHADCAYREKHKAPAYPVREAAGLIWTYIGPKELEPPFRTFDFFNVPESNRYAIRANTHANYLALWEGGVDSSHVGMLHTNHVRQSWVAQAKGEKAEPSAWDALAPTYDIENTEYGFRYCAFRDVPGEEGVKHARQTVVFLPCMRYIPGGDFTIVLMDVPMTDTTTATYQIAYRHDAPIDPQWAKAFLGFANDLYDEETCWVKMEWPHNMMQDRESMKTNWSGYPGVEMEDVAMSLSLREVDRSKEHLVPADLAVVRLRRILLNAVDKHEKSGEALGLNAEDLSHVVAYDRMLKSDENWKTV